MSNTDKKHLALIMSLYLICNINFVNQKYNSIYIIFQ